MKNNALKIKINGVYHYLTTGKLLFEINDSCIIFFTKLTYKIFVIISFPSILVKPSERPQVFGFKPRYRVGDTLSMTCYVNNTFPAANLTWFVNGKRVITTLKFILKTEKQKNTLF